MSTARSFRLEIFLVSLAAILLEISYTRIFSYKLHYYFTFLTLGVALLGLGAGGVFVAVFDRLRRIPAERLVAGCCLAGARLAARVHVEGVVAVVEAVATLGRIERAASDRQPVVAPELCGVLAC